MVLLNVTPEWIFRKGQPPTKVAEVHQPYFWAFPPAGKDAAAARRDLDASLGKLSKAAFAEPVVARPLYAPPADADESEDLAEVAAPLPPSVSPLAFVTKLGPLETVESFWTAGRKREAFRVYTKRPGNVPSVSDELFIRQGLYTGEHDVPYHQRVLVDMAAGVGHPDRRSDWVYDTAGRREKLKVLVYDIETTTYGNANGGGGAASAGGASSGGGGGSNDTTELADAKGKLPIDIIGFASFDVEYEASHDLDAEEFDFRWHHVPTDWQEAEARQLVAYTPEEEVDILVQFTRQLKKYDIISGHNILGFDNLQLVERCHELLRLNERQQTISRPELDALGEFLHVTTRKDEIFSFGRGDAIAHMHPTSLDTLLAARRFYFFLDDFTLKGLAPFLGVEVPDRIVLAPDQMALDDRTLLYNKQDVWEQLGVTQHLILQALPLAFTVGSPFEVLFTGANTKMWDHMAMIRAARMRRLMPATCRAQGIARRLLDLNLREPTKEAIVERARKLPTEERLGGAREFVRVAKYGDEMPDWVEYPYAVVKTAENARDAAAAKNDDWAAEATAYQLPGGLTLHPQELDSHFIPWWRVVAADVGAMYPTILKALNVGADTVRAARRGEEPDEWVWLYELAPEFRASSRWVARAPDPAREDYATRGHIIGIKRGEAPGVVNRAMSGLMKLISRTKKELGKAKKPGSGVAPEALKRLQMQYASLKAARNAGTHGILVAVNVSCRQFNLLAGAYITTTGQKILHELLKDFRKDGLRVVYGDTDGIYLACARSGAALPKVAAAYGVPTNTDPGAWMSPSEKALKAVEDANTRWRRELQYDDFELEPELHDAMVFVVHKNYLIFDARGGPPDPTAQPLRMETKGNNFKGSDKANLARVALERIMNLALRDVLEWKDEKEARTRFLAAIKKHTREVARSLDLASVDVDDLTLLQTVQPARRYKPLDDGSKSTWALRSDALGKLLGEKEGIRGTRKYKFVVTRKPLPGIAKPSKSGLKPIDFMVPVDVLDKGTGYSRADIDLDWYRDMVVQYVKGAFGLEDLSPHAQRGLDAFM